MVDKNDDEDKLEDTGDDEDEDKLEDTENMLPLEEPMNAFMKMTEMIIKMLSEAMNMSLEEIQKKSNIEVSFSPSIIHERSHKMLKEKPVPVDKDMVDIVDGGNFVSIIIEFSKTNGIPKVIHQKSNEILIQVDNITKIVNVPYEVDWEKMEYTYKNRILEIIIPKK